MVVIMENTNTNYILGGTGYVALLAAIVEQARNDSTKTDKTTGQPTADALDAMRGIKEWKEEVEADLNFNIYE